MQAALGLSMTSTGVAWVLLDGRDAEGAPLDHDAFDVAPDGGIAKHMAAVRGAQAIAAASGDQITAIALTWTDGLGEKARQLRRSLLSAGFDSVATVGLPQAARAWTRAFGPALGFETCAICVVEPDAATVLTVGPYTVQTAVTQSHEGLGSWLSDTITRKQWQPERLFLVGSCDDVESVSACLGDVMPMPAEASDEAQLALARGAALTLSADDEPTVDLSVGSVVDVVAARRRPRLGTHARAAAALAAGAVALFALVPALAGRDAPGTDEGGQAGAAPSASAVAAVNAVRSPAPPTTVRPVAAAPPSTVAVAAETEESEGVAAVPQADPVVASPVAAPVAAAPPEPAAVEHLPGGVQPAIGVEAPPAAVPAAVASPPVAPPPFPLPEWLVLPPWLAPPPPAPAPAVAPAPADVAPVAAAAPAAVPPAPAAVEVAAPPAAPPPPQPAAPPPFIANPLFIGLP